MSLTRAFFLTLLYSFVATQLAAQSTNLDAINSPRDEQQPVLSLDGKTLFFTVAHHEKNVGGIRDLGDIWYSTYVNGAWTPPRHGGPVINNAYYNAVAGYDSRREVLYLFNHYSAQGGLPTTRGIALSHRIDENQWQPPVNFVIPNFHNYSPQISGSINNKFTTLVFSANSFESLGEEDLYVTFFNTANMTWAEPINLGATLNTPAQELSPYLADDDSTLYFSTNAAGAGSFDVYQTKRMDSTWKKWSKPVSMSAKINDAGANAYFKITANCLALYVTKTNSKGYGDMKMIPIDTLACNAAKPEAEQETLSTNPFLSTPSMALSALQLPKPAPDLVTMAILDKTSGKLAVADIEVWRKADHQLLFRRSAVSKIELSPIADSTIVTIKKEGYLYLYDTLSATKEGDFFVFALTPVRQGVKFQFTNILFEKGTPNLMTGSQQVLDDITEFLHQNKSVALRVEGHTDIIGDGEKNLQLSQKRVKTVIRYFTQRGINKARLSGEGYGSRRPISTNPDIKQRAVNRRVEFIVVKE